MTRSRTLLALAGAAAVLVGVGVAIQPALALSLSVPSIPVSVIGGVALVFAFFIGLRRRNTSFRGAEPPTVESMLEYPRPGASFDESLRRAHGLGIDAATRRREGREDLAAVAIAVLEVTEGYSEDEADRALREGTWTDDPVAAACFASEPPAQGFRGLLSRYVDRRSRYTDEFVHAIDAMQRKLDEVGRA